MRFILRRYYFKGEINSVEKLILHHLYDCKGVLTLLQLYISDSNVCGYVVNSENATFV